MEYKDCYEVLGVPKTASAGEIKKAYRRLARELHPDRNPADASAEKRFKDVNEAQAVLLDPEKRKRYDELGANWQAYANADFSGAGASDWANFGGAPGGTRWTYRRVNADEVGGFSDFFREFFGGAGGQGFGGAGGQEATYDFGDLGGLGARSQTRVPAADVRAEAELTLAEVARGTERMVDVGGRRLQVKIPAGVADGARIKLRGGGMSGNGTSGDLYLTVRVKPDPRFERVGADLRTELPISLEEALLGGDVAVPTPTGKVKLRVRPNTQNGQEIRLAGRGLPKRGGEKGDLLVQARVVLPKLDEASREDFAAFVKAHPQPDPRTKVH